MRTRGAMGTWYGVSVESRDQLDRVVSVSLHHNRLRGEIWKSASQVAKLQYIEVLNLGHNRIRGKIPTALRWCETLRG